MTNHRKKLSELHRNIPRTPDYCAEISYLCCVTDHVNVLGLFSHGGRVISNRHNYRVCVDLEGISVLALRNNTAVGDLNNARFEMNRYSVSLEEVTEEACVSKADAGGYDKVVHHLNDGGLFALEVELVCDLTSRKSATDNGYVLANLFIAEEEVDRLNSSFNTLDGYSLCTCAGCNDNLVSAECVYVGDLCIELDLDGMLCDLTDVPSDKISVLLLE